MPLRAELYDWECTHVLGRTDEDVDWLVALAARSGGPVLELACGTGRVTVPLAARSGCTVVGLDVDTEMLQAARQRGAGPLLCGDMRSFALGRTFPFVVIAYNSLQLLDADGRDACLRSVSHHLAPGGLLALECTDFQHDVVTQDVGTERLGEGHLRSGAHVVLDGALHHDLDRRCTIYRRRFTVDGAETVDEVTIASLRDGDVVALLERNRFTVAEVERFGVRTRWVGTLIAP